MRLHFYVVLFIIILPILPSILLAEIHKEYVDSADNLQALLTEKVDSLEIYLQSGDYFLSSTDIIDSTCGNCEEPDQFVPATAGLQIAGAYVKISGPEDRSAVIHTNAGYGIFFNHCQRGLIENLSITDGVRDTSGFATDAAVVVKNSTITVRRNRIYENIGDSSIVVKNIVGIMGICGRENSDVTIADNEIVRNSWDGIALYRDARATIANNLIDGVDKASSKIAGGGRGVAIGVTWNGQATIEKNLVKRYWKGIGIFVDANVAARNNVIEDVLTWGIAYWDADKGRPVGVIEENIIYSTGACGITITRSQPGPNPGILVGNVVVQTAQNPKYDDPDYYCHQCALSIFSKPDNFEIRDNQFFNNREATEDLPDYDITETEFIESIDDIRRRLLITPLLQKSDFSKFLSEL
ncbi:MAG: right-handed parallel beta-helix repeat-containing protein [Gemmatimonadota bacterium]|nr:MAG: right-handed parallel beta-helix repeat-containing protein [Gemmatimonadota bacterium]